MMLLLKYLVDANSLYMASPRAKYEHHDNKYPANCHVICIQFAAQNIKRQQLTDILIINSNWRGRIEGAEHEEMYSNMLREL